MMYGYGTGMGGWGYALMIVSLLLLCGLVIVGIVALVRPAAHRRRDAGEPAEPPGLSGPPRPSDPEQFLAARFARGEIDEDEYQRRLAVLRETSQGADPRPQPGPGGSRNPGFT
jgi:putative membrane protein